MPIPVLLLRAPPDDGTPDKYAHAFRARGYPTRAVPVLETVPVNVDVLARMVGEGAAGFDGVIVTSGRACEAWRTALDRETDSDSSGPAGTAEQRGWSTVPFYAVGATTGSALHAIADTHPASPHAPRDVRGAAEAGTSERLARFIVDDLLGGSGLEPDGGGPSGSSSAEVGGTEVGGTEVGEDATRTGTRKGTGRGKKLLYLTGDKNRDTLPSILNEAGIALESVQVYATRGSARFETDVRAAMSALDPDEQERHWWIVHFAPSSARHVAPVLASLFDLETASSTTREGNRIVGGRARTAAIGPTTAAALTEELGQTVEVVAAKPTPEALVEGIVEWDRENDSRV